MAAQGWISVHRQIQCHWLWDDKPFSKGQAWIDLLMLANHEDKKFLFGGELIEVKSGSFITSIAKLTQRWGWSNTKVVKFLELLEKEEMIVKKSDAKKTAITIEKYSDFQDSENKKTIPKRYQNDTETILKHTNNNDNNDNNDNKNKYILSKPVKHKYGEYKNVLLTDEELSKLKAEYPDYEERIERLSSYVASTGKSYKSHYATIRNWARKDKKEGNANADNRGTDPEPQRRLGTYL